MSKDEALQKEPENPQVRAAERNRAIVRTSGVGIASNLVLALAKAVVGIFSNSIAIVLDAVNNLSDAASSIITIVGTKLAARRPDKKHPFGYGRIEYLTTIIIAVVVLWAGISSLQEAIGRIVNPELASYNTVTLVVVAVAVAAKVLLGLYTRSAGRRLNSGALSASGTDALMDSVISAATLAAALIYLFTGLALEAWLGAIISLVVIKAGVDMLREVLGRIIGQRIEPELARGVKESARSVEGVQGAYDLLLDDFGPDAYWGSIHVEVDDGMTAAQLDTLTRQIQQRVFHDHGVILHTVGFYSTNSDDPLASEIRSYLLELAEKDENILEVHGFYLDQEAKEVRFDLVVSFDAPDRHAVARRVEEELARSYPDFSFEATVDSDISD